MRQSTVLEDLRARIEGVGVQREAIPFGIDAIRTCAELGNGRASGDPVRVWGLDIARKRDWAVLIGLDSHRRVAVLHRWHGLSYGALVGYSRGMSGLSIVVRSPVCC